MKILALDLGKFNGVSCLFDTETNTTEFETFKTHRIEFEGLFSRTQPQLIVRETGSITRWVHDLCVELGDQVLVANPSAQAWRGKNVKRKTDGDDALKLAKLAALDQINPVYVPTPQSRQYRHLVKYRETVSNRINRIQNNSRALFDQQGLKIPQGHQAWKWQALKN